MFAETAYLFRHGLLRDAAYELQPPNERGRLHQLALQIMESLFSAADLEPLSIELAEHARLSAVSASDATLRESLLDKEAGYLEIGVELLRRTWQVTEELNVREQLANHPQIDPATQRKHIRQAIGRASQQGDLQRWLRLAEEFLERSRAVDDAADETRALLALADARRHAGQDWTSGVALLTLQERADGLELEDRLTALRLRQIEAARNSNPDAERRMLEQALQIARGGKLDHWEASLTGDLAHRFLADGKPEEAIEMAAQAVRIAERSGDKHMLAQCRNHQGIIYVETGDVKSAERSYGEARQMAHEIGAYGLELTIAVNAGNLHLYFMGNLALAEREYLVALGSAYERGAVEDTFAILIRLSALYASKDDYESSYQRLQEMLQLAQRVHAPAAELAATVQMCRCRAPITPQDRLAAGVQGIQLARRLNNGRSESEGWVWIAMLLCEQGAFSASKRAAEYGRRSADSVPAAYAFGLHAQATRGKAELLTGQVIEAQACACEFLDNIGRNAPHHRVAKGEVVLLAALVQEAVGPAGTGTITAELRATIAAKREEMRAAVIDSEYRLYGRTRAALEYAERLVQLAEGAAPYPLFFGVTPEFLTDEQLSGMVRHMETEQPELLIQLQQDNAGLWKTILERNTPGWPAWNACLEDLPGVDALLKDMA
ncbi:MAG: tetratricopeptide repeat protein [Planctomycetota bacterium]